METENDFGFSFSDPADFEQDQTEIEQLEQQVAEYKAKEIVLRTNLSKIYHRVNTLLSNLSKHPEKTDIHWPNRVESINNFREEIQLLAFPNETTTEDK